MDQSQQGEMAEAIENVLLREFAVAVRQRLRLGIATVALQPQRSFGSGKLNREIRQIRERSLVFEFSRGLRGSRLIPVTKWMQPLQG